MRRRIVGGTALVVLGLCTLRPASGAVTDTARADVEKIVDESIRPLMQRLAIPGMAVGIVFAGRSDVFDYGVASRTSGRPIDASTLFELGSVSKTFTATLAAYAQVRGRLALSDPVSKYLPTLRGSSFDAVSLLNLGTHTSGGLPLQVPDAVTDDAQLMRWLRHWKPTRTPGTSRTYGNPGIGLLGRIAAASLREDFVTSMERGMFPALGLKDTYLRVPAARLGDYAQGYTDRDAPLRMSPGVLADEAYGVRATAADLLRFVAANLDLIAVDASWRRALIDTHVGYYRVGAMTQDLIWEQYRDPVALPDLQAGNATGVSLAANPADRLDPPSPAGQDVLIDKTGSTNGFSTYVVFVPRRKIGIVLLANKRYPIEERIAVAYALLTRLTDRTVSH